MQYFPQQQYGGVVPQYQQQCLSCPNNNNLMAGLFQQPQYSPYGAFNPQQYYNNPYQQQQFCYPQQQQQFYYPQQQQQLYYPQLQQQQQFPFYPQQQWPVSFLGQNAYGNQQYWPQQQQRVYEDAPTPLPPMRHKKGKSNKH